MNITRQAWQIFYRAQRFADVPAVLQLLKFRELRRKYYEALWKDAAAEIGATTARDGFGYIRISKGDLCTFVRQDRVMLDSHLTLNLMGNKAITYELLENKGCPIPAHLLFDLSKLAAAEAFMRKLGKPAVVKPVSGTGGGQGVTTGIRDAGNLRKAARNAARFGSKLLVEEELEGHSYRLLYVEGELLHAVRRDPPILRGDGKSSLTALAKIENARRLAGKPVVALSPLRLDREAANTLIVQNRKISDVPGDGVVVTVKRAINENSSDRNHTVTADVHPETAASCSRLVRDLGVQFAGIDIISKDISVPLSDNGGCIGEINTTPGIHHHYLLATSPEGQGIAARLLDHMFRTGTGTLRLGATFGTAVHKDARDVA